MRSHCGSGIGHDAAVAVHLKFRPFNISDPHLTSIPPLPKAHFKMATSGMVDPRIFEDLQTKIDEDADTREQLKTILQLLERQGRHAQSVLSRAHSTPAAQCE